jgi:hypothetical protein
VATNFMQAVAGTVTTVNAGAHAISVVGSLSNAWSQVGDDSADWTEVWMRDSFGETPTVMECTFLPTSLPVGTEIIDVVPIINCLHYGGDGFDVTSTSAYVGCYVGSFPFPPPINWLTGSFADGTMPVNFSYEYEGITDVDHPASSQYLDSPTLTELNAGVVKIGAIGGYDPDADTSGVVNSGQASPHTFRILGARLDITWKYPKQVPLPSGSSGTISSLRQRQRR